MFLHRAQTHIHLPGYLSDRFIFYVRFLEYFLLRLRKNTCKTFYKIRVNSLFVYCGSIVRDIQPYLLTQFLQRRFPFPRSPTKFFVIAVRLPFNSLILAAGTAAAGTALCWLGAYASVRTPSIPAGLQKSYRTLAAIPICIPGTVLGLAWAMTFAGFSLFKEPAGAMTLLICNTLVHLYTVPHLTAVTGLKTLNARYETVGATLGASRMSTLCRVIVPLSARELAEMFSYLFASAVTTISSVVFLYTPKSIVAAVAAIDMIDSGFISEGAAMASLIFISALFVRMLAIAAVRSLHPHQ